MNDVEAELGRGMAAIVRATMRTADASGALRATLVMSRIRGRWLMVASHSSALAQ
ncbi:MAG: nuclear transport factor 2 family protein [Longimicrobiaceae bacterium]